MVTISAHAYRVEDGEYVFSILMRGSPAYEVDIVRLPDEIVVRSAT